MALVSQRVDDILGGVSQSPATSSSPSEWTEQINCLPAPEKGLQRRPPLLHTATIDPSNLSSAFVQRLGHFNVIVANGVVKVVDVLTGALQTVFVKSGAPYLTGGTYKGLSSGDSAFILNTSKVIQKASTRSPAVVPEAFLYIRQGDYSTAYTVTIAGVAITYTTPANTGSAIRAQIDTKAIAVALAAAITADAGLSALFSVLTYGSTIRIARQDGKDFPIRGSDGLGDQGMVVVNGQVQTFSDLPLMARPGAVVEVVGSSGTLFDNYFVQYTPTVNPGEPGTWKEVVKPGALVALNTTTLPVRVVRNGDYATGVEADVFPPAFIAPVVPSKSTLVYTDNGATAATSLYPKGTVYNLIIEVTGSPGVTETAFNYTVTGELETGAQVTAGLTALIAANALYTAVAFFGGPGGNSILVGRATPTVPPTITALAILDNTHVFWSPDIAMVTNEHVGRNLVNVSTGDTRTISANTVNTITVSGAATLFSPADSVAVRGTGEYFIVETCPWTNRMVGDDTTAPMPSLVGNAAEDLFIHQGRLGFVFKRNAVMSQAGDLYNFFRQTATEILSSDPIDITTVGAGSSAFHSAVEWDGKLFFWTEESQYLLSGEPVLTPSTVSLTKVSEYRNVSTIRPVVAGQRVFFVGERSGFVHLMEYHAKALTSRVYEATDTGAEIPTYISGSATALVVDDALGVVLLATDTNSGRSLFCYSYRYRQDQLTHAAWGRWDFVTGRVIALDIIDGVVGVIQAYADTTCLNTIVFDPTLLLLYEGFADYDGSLDFSGLVFFDGGPDAMEYTSAPAYLDRHILTTASEVSTVYDGTRTTWTLPYQIAIGGTDGELVVTGDNSAVELASTRPALNKIAVLGDYTGQRLHIGVRYSSRSVLPEVYVRDPRTGVPETRGRLQVRFLRVYYANLTKLVVTVAQPGRILQTYTKSSILHDTGSFLVPVQSQNDGCTITLVTDSAGADTILRYEWEGTYHTRASRF